MKHILIPVYNMLSCYYNLMPIMQGVTH